MRKFLNVLMCSAVLLVSPLLGGCGILSRSPEATKLEVIEKPAPTHIQIPPDPAPIRAPDIDSRDFFKGITAAEIAKLDAQVAAGEIPPYAFVCLTDQAYLTLAAWVADVRRYAAEVRATLDSYKRNIERESKP